MSSPYILIIILLSKSKKERLFFFHYGFYTDSKVFLKFSSKSKGYSNVSLKSKYRTEGVWSGVVDGDGQRTWSDHVCQQY